MPENLDFTLYFNIVFFSLVILGFVFGYLRGFRKSLYSLIVMAIFYVFFFVTIDLVVSRLWVLEVPSLIERIAPFVPEVSGSTSFEQAITAYLETALPENMSSAMSNERFLAFIFGLGQFILKIAYTIFYFTVFQLIYRILMFFIRILFFRAKEKGLGKARLPGAFVGAGKGLMSAFVTLIVLGGMMSVMESFLALVPEDEVDDTNGGNQTVAIEDAYYLYGAYGMELNTVIPTQTQTETEQAFTTASEMVDAYNKNVFVRGASSLSFEADGYPSEVTLHMYLFDTVMSFEYQEEKVKLRKELVIYADIGRIFLESDFADSRDISDVTGDDIREAFRALSNSELFTSLVPLGIELGSEYYEKELSLDIDDLYAIDWQTEIMQLGEIVAVGFDLVSSAGLLEENPSLETITLSGEDVEGLFDEFADSELMTLAAYVAMEPLLESMSAEMQSIITVPADLDWAAEFRAFGDVAGAILNTGITVADLNSGDMSLILGSLSSLDLTILLDSQIVSEALINVFSKEANVTGLEMIVVPDSVVWEDTYDGDTRIDGELRNILNAVNAITDVAGNFDFNDITIQVIAEFDEATIDELFGSRVLVASISTFMLDMELGSVPLIIPESTLGVEGYILKTELSNLANSARVLVEEMACDEGDTTCEDQGFDVGKAFTLEESVIDILLTSEILSSTIGYLVIDSGQDALTIPSIATEIVVDGGVDVTIVTSEEIKNMFLAVGVFGFDDIGNITFDPTIIQSLSVEGDPLTLDETKSQKLYDSLILHATLSSIIIDQTEGVDSVLVVPLLNEFGDPVRLYDAADDITYVSETELNAILQGIISLEITSFNDVGSLDITGFLDKLDILLDSAIMHATLSERLLVDTAGALVIPDTNVNTGNPVRIVQSDVTYVASEEILALMDGLGELGLTDFSGLGFDPATIFSADFSIILESASLQATISDNVLATATDELAPGAAALIIPSSFRETISVDGVTVDQVVKTELNALLDSLSVLGISTFDGGVDTSIVTSMGDTEIDTLLASASMHLSISQLLKDAFGTDVPDLAKETVYAVSDVVTATEVKNFIKATQVLGQGDFTSASFDLAAISSLTPTEQDTVLSSMTVRNILTPALETVAPFNGYTLTNSDYMNDDPTTFLTKAAALAIIN